MSPIAPKFYAGIDYDYRPESFWAVASTPFEIALRNVKGRQRRKLIRDHFAKGELDQFPDDLLKESLDDETQTVWDRIHPTFMGGEYLPNYHRNEVEIARIELDSTTHDVMNLRARPTGSRIKYSLVDEYQTDYQLPQLTSSKPFSLVELIRVLDLTEPSEGTPSSAFPKAIRQLGREQPTWWPNRRKSQNYSKARSSRSTLFLWCGSGTVNPDQLAARCASLKNAFISMGGAVVHHATVPENARQLFYQTWPGWTFGTYRAFDLPAEDSYLADLIPWSATFTGHLEGATLLESPLRSGPINGVACLPRLPEVPPGQKLYPVWRFEGLHSRN